MFWDPPTLIEQMFKTINYQIKLMLSVAVVPVAAHSCDTFVTVVCWTSGQTAIGIDVDCMSHYFYWTDVSGKTISRARLDGTDSEVLLQSESLWIRFWRRPDCDLYLMIVDWS